MEEKRKSATPAWIVGITGLALVAALATYVWGYLALEKATAKVNNLRIRVFRTQWQATIYQPAGYIEALVMGREVYIRGPESPPATIVPKN